LKSRARQQRSICCHRDGGVDGGLVPLFLHEIWICPAAFDLDLFLYRAPPPPRRSLLRRLLDLSRLRSLRLSRDLSRSPPPPRSLSRRWSLRPRSRSPPYRLSALSPSFLSRPSAPPNGSSPSLRPWDRSHFLMPSLTMRCILTEKRGKCVSKYFVSVRRLRTSFPSGQLSLDIRSMMTSSVSSMYGDNHAHTPSCVRGAQYRIYLLNFPYHPLSSSSSSSSS